MANLTKTVDRAGNEINSLEESMHYISCRLDELSGCAMSNSYLNVSVSDLDIPETNLDKVEQNLEQIQIGISNLDSTLSEINSTSIETNNNLELIMMQLSRIADALEKK